MRRGSLLCLMVLACDPAPVEAPVGPPPPEPPKPQPEAEPQPEEGPNRPPKLGKMSFLPAAPKAGDGLRIQVEASDPEGGIVELEYSWLVNGRPASQFRRDNVPAGSFHKGDRVSVEVLARDSEGMEAKDTSAELTIGNSAPMFTADPRDLGGIEGFKVKAEDPDKDMLGYSLSGAPQGMTVDPKTGVLHYKGSAEEPGGHYAVVVKVDDGDGGTAEWRFEVDVSPGSAAKKAEGKAGSKAGGKAGGG